MPLDNANTSVTLPFLALRGIVAFPGMYLTVDIGRKMSIKAAQAAADTDRHIFLITQRDTAVESPELKDLYGIGCVCRIRQILKTNEGVKILVQGLYRADIKSFEKGGSFLVGTVERLYDSPIKNRQVYIETLLRRVRAEFERLAKIGQFIGPEISAEVQGKDNLGSLCDFIAFNVPAPFDDKQYILEQLSIVNRAKILIEMLSKERQITEIDKRIGEKTRHQIDENQREYYLKEQIRAINEELYGEESDTEEYYAKIDRLKADDSVKKRLAGEVSKLSKLPQGSHDGAVLRSWLDTCIELPWNNCTANPIKLDRAAKILDRDFYGMKKVKERIIEMLSVYALNPDIKGQIICLAGPPGVGKTSIGKTIAECMGRSFARISLGGMHDEAEIRGHRKTYVGAMAGRIINAIKQSGCSDPLILLDEIDKLGSDYKGDPSSALLEVLDPEQNSTFCDNYIEIPYDLSRAVFITTANSLDMIPGPLLDRMEIIDLDGYTREEKFHIAKKHLVSKQLTRHALTNKTCKITDGTLYSLIDFYTREAGVRKLERAVASLCRKAAKKIATGECNRLTIKENDLESLIGNKKFRPEVILERDEVGIINGLAWTAVGGEIMQLEVVTMKGTGKVELTGSLGDIMKESAAAAVTFVRSNAQKYGIDEDFYKNLDIHIHATEAAVPKDGPSAGITITVALISALTGREVRRDIAMTGEITVRGRVLPIGGLKEKSMAAYRGGVKTIFFPRDNTPDLQEVDETVKTAIRFIPVAFASEVIDKALLPLEEKALTDISFTAESERHGRVRL